MALDAASIDNPELLRRMRTEAMATAFHEVGHVLLRDQHDFTVVSASISPSWFFDDCSGLTTFEWPKESKGGTKFNELPEDVSNEHDAISRLAGPEAERIFRSRYDLGSCDESAWYHDLYYAGIACKEGGLSFNDMRGRAYREVSRRWSEVHSLALLLERRKRLNKGAIKKGIKIARKA